MEAPDCKLYGACSRISLVIKNRSEKSLKTVYDNLEQRIHMKI